MMRIRSKVHCLSTLLSACILTGSLAADTIFLRNGQVLENVVSVGNEGGYLIIFRNGTTMGLKKEQVLRIQVQGVLWKPETVIEYRDTPAEHPDEEKQEQNEPISDHDANGDKYPYSFVPGWQQYREGRIAKSALFVGLFAGGFVGIADARYRYLRNKERQRAVIFTIMYYENLNHPQSGVGETAWLISSNFYGMQLNRNRQLRTQHLEGAYLATFTIYVLNFLDAVFFSPPQSANADEQPGAQFLFAFAPATGGGRTEFYLGLQATF